MLIIDTYGIIYVLRLITSASHLTTFTPCYIIQTPALLARDESQQPSRRNGAGFVLSGALSMEKICTRCGFSYPATLEYFRSAKLGKYGLKSECRTCTLLRDAENRRKHAEKRAETNAAYRKAHPEWVKEVKRRHYNRHRSAVIAKSQEYRINNPEYWKRSKEKEAQKSANRHARKKNAPGQFTTNEVLGKYEAQCRKCFYCLCDLNGQYQVDHYIPLARGGTNWPDNIVLACPKCNFRKGDRLPSDFVARFL